MPVSAHRPRLLLAMSEVPRWFLRAAPGAAALSSSAAPLSPPPANPFPPPQQPSIVQGATRWPLWPFQT